MKSADYSPCRAAGVGIGAKTLNLEMGRCRPRYPWTRFRNRCLHSATAQLTATSTGSFPPGSDSLACALGTPGDDGRTALSLLITHLAAARFHLFAQKCGDRLSRGLDIWIKTLLVVWAKDPASVRLTEFFLGRLEGKLCSGMPTFKPSPSAPLEGHRLTTSWDDGGTLMSVTVHVTVLAHELICQLRRVSQVDRFGDGEEP